MRPSLLLLSGLLCVTSARAADLLTVHVSSVADQKAVIATVEPVRQLVARARIGGTITALDIREGDLVTAGQEVARVTDPKLQLQMQALDARIQSLQAQRDLAKTEFDRISELQKRGVSSTTQLDQARTTLDVAERSLQAMNSDRSVLEQQAAEGAVLAPGAGRVLNVPVSEGRVVMPGETIATLAEDKYILRLQLPERHARFLRAGDTVEIAARGLAQNQPGDLREGKVRLVYPEIQGGRVIADVDVSGLGDYFVGERTRVYVNTGERQTIIVPQDYVFQRAGINYVRLANGSDVVVQLGEMRREGVEILAGLKDGDQLVKP